VAGIVDQASIFWATRDLDRIIAALGGVGGERSREIARLLEKLYALRKRLEFDQPRYLMGIRSSRQMAMGQRIRLLVTGLGVFGSTLIDNNARYLVLSWPLGMKLPKGFVWKGKKVSVYFWRRDDAGYVFDSYVLDDLRIKDVPVIHVAQSESLLRTQKRKSIRAKTTLPAWLYLLKRVEGAFEKPELEQGLRSRLIDLSEDGFSLAIGGKAKVGLKVKAQFNLGDRQIVMSGTVKSLDFDRDKNQSILHVEAVSPSPKTRNAIRSYVYGSKAKKEDSRNEAEG
jgi:c-di-GMP-binding flagellar brake protein YcgR